MKGLAALPDIVLIEVYWKTIDLNLDQEFKDILVLELHKRGITSISKDTVNII